MDSDAILSFHTPGREGPRVTCAPSSVMELVYAQFYLQRRMHHARSFEVPWAGPLLSADPEVGRDFEAYWAQHGLEGPGVALFVLAARYGFVYDGDPERFLNELPNLAERYARDGEHLGAGDDGDEYPDQLADLRRRIEVLRDERQARALATLLRRLWAFLSEGWEQHGRSAVVEAVRAFDAEFRRTSSVLEALPAHHFTRFEHLAQTIREAAATARVAVVPLWLAASGGFGFRVDDVQYVGYGLQSEHAFERTAERVFEVARRVKALADPNRLLALALVSTFAGMRPTVGDLAHQIGVSQPTVSGHLRLLREAGLVAVEKQGNKAFYRLDPDAVRALLHDLEDTLLR
jgi:ArsR family transcriptional regulator, arsenate/arsenite/antimonite-responsive transcriptional repressor